MSKKKSKKKLKKDFKKIIILNFREFIRVLLSFSAGIGSMITFLETTDFYIKEKDCKTPIEICDMDDESRKKLTESYDKTIQEFEYPITNTEADFDSAWTEDMLRGQLLILKRAISENDIRKVADEVEKELRKLQN